MTTVPVPEIRIAGKILAGFCKTTVTPLRPRARRFVQLLDPATQKIEKIFRRDLLRMRNRLSGYDGTLAGIFALQNSPKNKTKEGFTLKELDFMVNGFYSDGKQPDFSL